MLSNLQIGVIGAVQRAAPLSSSLFLQWLAIEDIELSTFDIADDQRGGSATLFRPSPFARNGAHTRDQFLKFIGVPEGANEYSTGSVSLHHSSPYHQLFWSRVLKKDARELRSPLEFWWSLACIRLGGPIRASDKLLQSVGVKPDSRLKNCVVSFENDSIDPAARTTSKALVDGVYKQPYQMNIFTTLPSAARKLAVKHELLTVKLTDSVQRDLVVSNLMKLCLNSEDGD